MGFSGPPSRGAIFVRCLSVSFLCLYAGRWIFVLCALCMFESSFASELSGFPNRSLEYWAVGRLNMDFWSLFFVLVISLVAPALGSEFDTSIFCSISSANSTSRPPALLHVSQHNSDSVPHRDFGDISKWKLDFSRDCKPEPRNSSLSNTVFWSGHSSAFKLSHLQLSLGRRLYDTREWV